MYKELNPSATMTDLMGHLDQDTVHGAIKEMISGLSINERRILLHQFLGNSGLTLDDIAEVINIELLSNEVITLSNMLRRF